MCFQTAAKALDVSLTKNQNYFRLKISPELLNPMLFACRKKDRDFDGVSRYPFQSGRAITQKARCTKFKANLRFAHVPNPLFLI